MEGVAVLLGSLLWAPCAWQLFKSFFGSPEQFEKKWRDRRGSETRRYLRDGFKPAFFAQAFETGVWAFLAFNLLMWLICIALVDMVLT